MTGTYNPRLDRCYACSASLREGDWIVGYFEHYMHDKCAPLFILECKIPFQYKEKAG